MNSEKSEVRNANQVSIPTYMSWTNFWISACLVLVITEDQLSSSCDSVRCIVVVSIATPEIPQTTHNVMIVLDTIQLAHTFLQLSQRARGYHLDVQAALIQS